MCRNYNVYVETMDTSCYYYHNILNITTYKEKSRGGFPVGDNSHCGSFAFIVENLMAAEPFTKRGKEAFANLETDPVTADEFLSEDGLYEPPFTGITDFIDRLDSKEKSDFETYSAEENKQSLENEESVYRNRLERLGSSFFLIKGAAGCGKTTYMQKLRHDIESSFTQRQPYLFHVYNFEVSYPTPRFNEHVLHFDDFDSKDDGNRWRFISIATKEVFKLLGYSDGGTFKKYAERIRKIASIYKRSFISKYEGDNEDCELFFEILESTGTNPANMGTTKALGKDVVQFFKERYDKYDGERAITFVIALLIRLYFCISRIDASKFLCVFDNIEDYITLENDRASGIMEFELSSIFDAVKKAMDDFASPLKRIRDAEGKNYKTFCGFMFVCRQSTYLGSGTENNSRGVERIDITDWFCASAIFKKRLKYFGGLIGDDLFKEHLKAFNLFMQDRSKFKRNLYRTIEQMYNGSKRRMSRLVSEALGKLPVSDVAFFNEQWTKAFEIPANASSAEASREVCRRYVLSILLGAVKQEHLEHMRVVTELPHNWGSMSTVHTYARKIVMYLHNNEIRRGTKSVKFTALAVRILSGAYDNDPAGVSQNSIAELARILFAMNDRRWEFTRWGSLIQIEGKGLNLHNEAVFERVLAASWSLYLKKRGQSDSDIEIKLTNAGRLFACRIAPDFEWFSRLFAKPGSYVFPLINPNHPQPESERCLEILEIFGCVLDNALLCVNGILESEGHYYKPPGKQTPDYKPIYKSNDERSYTSSYKEDKFTTQIITHPLRIIQKIVGCVSKYLIFMKSSSFDGDTTKALRLKLSEFCSEAKDIILDNQDYFAYDAQHDTDSYKYTLLLDKYDMDWVNDN